MYLGDGGWSSHREALAQRRRLGWPEAVEEGAPSF